MSSQQGIQLQERDLELLCGLFESRIMTLRHITAIYFDGHAEAAKKRVQKLKFAGLLRERMRRQYEPSILFLSKKGFTLLSEGGHLSDYPRLTRVGMEGRAQVSQLTLRHELEVMDVKGAFFSAIRSHPSLILSEFSTWPRLNQFNVWHPTKETKITVKPDGFIRLQEALSDGLSEYVFFLELDRSTEVRDILATKALCYLHYYKSGGLAVQSERTRKDFRAFPFRLLIVCKTRARRDNIVRRLRATNPPLRTFVLLTTVDEVTTNPLRAIWITPAEREFKSIIRASTTNRSVSSDGHRLPLARSTDETAD